MDKPRLIVVDDVMEMASFIAEVAELQGFETTLTNRAEKLLEELDREQFDLMVIDLYMPDMDGFELIDALANRGCQAAIILMSGYDRGLLAGAGRIVNARGLKLINTLTKPVSLKQLEAALLQAKMDLK